MKRRRKTYHRLRQTKAQWETRHRVFQTKKPIRVAHAAPSWLVQIVSRIVRESGDSLGFNAAKWTFEWLSNPNPALGGVRPSKYLGTRDGRVLVVSLVRQMQSGAYA